MNKLGFSKPVHVISCQIRSDKVVLHATSLFQPESVSKPWEGNDSNLRAFLSEYQYISFIENFEFPSSLPSPEILDSFCFNACIVILTIILTIIFWQSCWLKLKKYANIEYLRMMKCISVSLSVDTIASISFFVLLCQCLLKGCVIQIQSLVNQLYKVYNLPRRARVGLVDGLGTNILRESPVKSTGDSYSI